MNAPTAYLAKFALTVCVLTTLFASALAQSKQGVPAQVWSLKGNADAGPDAFLGTTDDTPLMIGTNGRVSILIRQDGSVQIGTEENQVGLDVYGNLWVSGSVTGLRGSIFGSEPNYQRVDSVGLMQFQGTGNYGVASGRYVYQTLNGSGLLTGVGLRNALSGNSLEVVDGSSAVASIGYSTGNLTTNGSVNAADSVIAGDARIAGTLGVGGPNSDPENYAVFINGRLRSAGINELSDARMKSDVQTIDGALESVLAMRGVRYTWNRDRHPELNLPEGDQLGLIAQEVEPVLPELVQTDVNGVKTVEYAHVVAVLIEAVKEQQRLLEQQGLILNSMQSELNELRQLASAQ